MSHRPMLECDLVFRAKDADEVLEALQDAALLHVAPIEIPESLASELGPSGDGEFEADADVIAASARLDRRRRALANVAPAPARLQDTDASYNDVTRIVDDLLARRDGAEDALRGITAQAELLAPWGEMAPEDVEALEAAGVRTTFAHVTRDQWNKLDRRALTYAVAGENETWVYAVFFTRENEGEGATPLDVDGVDLPHRRLSEVLAQREQLESEIRRINRELGRYAHFRPLMDERMAALADRVELIRARQKGLHHASLLAVTGYLPDDAVASFQRTLSAYDVAFILKPVGPNDDRAPVSLKNGPFTRGFEAVVQAFSGMSYHEKDYTWAAGILFIVFGSLCLLDGGYGILLLLTGIGLKLRGNDAFGRVFAITGAFSILVGALAGQFFGLVVGVDIMKDSAPPLTLAQVPYHAFVFSLVVGICAIAFSYTVAIWQRGIRTQATGSLLLVIAAVSALFGDAIVGTSASDYVLTILNGWQPVPEGTLATVAVWGNRMGALFFALAVTAWVLFPEPVFGPTARAGNVAWTLYSGTTGFVQDLLSHMRLFGIALSGSIMALVVNNIGGQFPFAITVVFAVVGHVFVYVLSLLSLYIHTNRLIFLEFGSKCIDGGQNFYSPLRRNAA